MKFIGGLTSILLSLGYARPADFPQAEIGNGEIQVKMYLPNAKRGYYRGTRFDWSGVLYSLQFKGHDYYGPWFQKTNPTIHDFIYEDSDIVAGPCSAISGPVDEFGEVGWDDAKPGGNFIKIGVGALRKPADGKYDNYHLYEIANPGKWTVAKHADSVEFTQDLADSSSGYSYLYRKTVRLVAGKPEMILEHHLKNRGTHAIHTSVYNHNFLVLDGQPPGPGLAISVPFQIQTSRPPNKELAEIRGNQIVYLKTLKDRDVVATPIQGFGTSPDDNQIRIENSLLGAGMRIAGDHSLLRESLWSIRTVIAMEPFVPIDVEPGNEFSWKTVYDYYTVPQSEK
ncbi:MAG TPA: hypothetical protein VHZ07_26825 [Bryobacteraceae bacterium]|jgi:hypothetical protein|nr:hypothetical protein [Bryobacteraceae bacterium]